MQVIDLPPGRDMLPVDPFHLMLAELRRSDSTSLIKFKRDAFRLKDLAKKQVKLGNIHQLMAAAYGYKTLAALQAAADGDGNVKNISE